MVVGSILFHWLGICLYRLLNVAFGLVRSVMFQGMPASHPVVLLQEVHQTVPFGVVVVVVVL